VIDLREDQNERHLIRCESIRNLFQMKSMKVIRNLKGTIKKRFEHDEELWSL
jgi:hypothetical protein